MDFVDAEDMFGGDDSDTGSDEADEVDEPAVSDVAPVTVHSGDEKDPPSKEEPAAVAAELRAKADGAQEDGGDDTGVGADGGSGGSSTAAASTDADRSISLGDKTNTGGVGNNSAADGGGSAAGSGGGGDGGGGGGKSTGKLPLFMHPHRIRV